MPFWTPSNTAGALVPRLKPERYLPPNTLLCCPGENTKYSFMVTKMLPLAGLTFFAATLTFEGKLSTNKLLAGVF